ncbi:mandelate racemase/muconate lactonizing enzyme family protein [Actinomadura sp. B10D3]|uniref:mandelate racemase/muconate lactonizing enzyme family protein n=1 Tax=Actinomadura sp. B10D3 TaxID=3153557 RepID=UPI00325D05D1
MDRVIGVDVFTLNAPVPPFSDARHDVREREVMWVRIRTADGIEGWGEAAVWGGPAEVTAAILKTELAPMVLGEDPAKIHFLWEKLYQHTAQHGRRGAVVAAMGSIDIALWDVLGQRCGVSLATLLGRHSDDVLPYASAGFYAPGKDLAALGAEFKGLRDLGFRAFKMKVGRQRREWSRVWERTGTVGLADDVERVFAVREAIGPDALLMVDANTEWDLPTAVRFLRDIEPARPFFIEEPVSPDLYHQAAEIRRKTDCRVAGFETEYTRFAYRELLAAGAVDVVQPDPCWCGGLSEARRIAAMAAAYGRLCVPHSISSAFSFLISAQFVASLENGFLVEWDATGSPWMDRYLHPGLLTADGRFAVPDRPGHGFRPDLDELGEAVTEL